MYVHRLNQALFDQSRSPLPEYSSAFPEVGEIPSLPMGGKPQIISAEDMLASKIASVQGRAPRASFAAHSERPQVPFLMPDALLEASDPEGDACNTNESNN